MRRRAAHAAILAVVFTALAAWSWRRWPDVLVDFGRELYVAWRLAEGDVLYRDVASFYGPLSPYLNALWFRVFGPGLVTLAVLNMAITAAVTAGLYTLVRRAAAGSAWGALAGALVFLSTFAFAHLIANGGFNFVAPYAHEATHGFALALAGILCALRAIDAARPRAWASASGALVGLAFLTKPEAFVAGLGTTAALLAFDGAARRKSAVHLLPYAAGFVAPPLFALALLALAMPLADAGRGVLGSWAYAGNDAVRANWYHAWTMGLDSPRANAAALARAAGAQVALGAAVAALVTAARRKPAWRVPLAVAAAAGVAVLLSSADWFQAARPLPLWTALALVAACRALWRRRDEPDVSADAARVALCAFALLLLPRMILNARLFHYGFVLAVPATLVLCAALLDWIPRALDRRGGGGAVVRAAAVAAIAVGVAFHLVQSHRRMHAKAHPVGSGRDLHYANARGPYVAAAMEGLAGLEPRDGTLATLPEGVMLNYLLRRRTSLPYLTMLPSDLATFGEDELLAALQRAPPDFIALVHRDTSEMGPQFFGRDYGRRTVDWIEERYAPAGGVGDPPNRPGAAFGIRVLRRKERRDEP